MNFAAHTDVGQKRSGNEDSFLALPDIGLFLVADGMGGHGDGEVASKMVCETLQEFCQKALVDHDITWPARGAGKSYEEDLLEVAIGLANTRIWDRSASLGLRGSQMSGSTAVAILLAPTPTAPKQVVIAHAGDSRCYRFRKNRLTQLTTDHNMISAWEASQGRPMTPDELANFHYANVITKAVGLKENLTAEVQLVDLEPGDRFLLCSDGLSGEVSAAEIEAMLCSALPLRSPGNLQQAVNWLVQAANDNGGKDNITAVLVEPTL